MIVGSVKEFGCPMQNDEVDLKYGEDLMEAGRRWMNGVKSQSLKE